jgi:hypothetical protein
LTASHVNNPPKAVLSKDSADREFAGERSSAVYWLVRRGIRLAKAAFHPGLTIDRFAVEMRAETELECNARGRGERMGGGEPCSARNPVTGFRLTIPRQKQRRATSETCQPNASSSSSSVRSASTLYRTVSKLSGLSIAMSILLSRAITLPSGSA